jgi:hypothetical protein
MQISDRDLGVIKGALTLAVFRASVAGNDDAEDILKDVSIRVSLEIQRRAIGPFTLSEARDSGRWYRRMGDARWRKEINGEMHCRTDAPGSRPFRDDSAELVHISDGAANDWEISE